jgi:hypothetical protein
MEKNIRIISINNKIVLKIYSFNGSELLILLVLIYLLSWRLSYSFNFDFLSIKDWALSCIKLFSVLKIFQQFSYNAFEKMIIEKNKIILEYYFFPFFLRFHSVELINNTKLTIKYNDEPLKIKKYKVPAKDYFPSTMHLFFPKLFRKYHVGNCYSNWIPLLFHPDKNARGIHFISDGNEHGFGTFLLKKDYDEILALILEQREKWEKEHPEEKIIEASNLKNETIENVDVNTY